MAIFIAAAELDAGGAERAAGKLVELYEMFYQLSHATIMELGEPIGNFHCRAVDRFFWKKMRETAN